jgi:hypothetical protein
VDISGKESSRKNKGLTLTMEGLRADRAPSGDVHDKFCQGENGDFPLTKLIMDVPYLPQGILGKQICADT